jgi:hypothetical protein
MTSASVPKPTKLERDMPDAGTSERLSLRQLIAPVLVQTGRSDIVPLDRVKQKPVGPEDALTQLDWPAAIQLIREVGGRTRQSRKAAQEAVRQAQALADYSQRQSVEAERRLRAAEAMAEAAIRRAEQAESAAQAAEMRARQAEEEMGAARAGQVEAQVWLKRLYSCVLTEFEGLTDDPPCPKIG